VKRLILIVIGTVLVVVAGGYVWLYTPSLERSTLMARYDTAASQFLPLPGGGEVHVQVEGAPDGSPLVLLHGSNSHLLSWDPWVAELQEFQIVTIDLPGHGLTGTLPNGRYTVAEAVQIVHHVVEALDLARVVIGGSSRGGAVAALYTVAHAERVAGLVLVDASGWLQGQDVPEEPEDMPLGWRLARLPVISAAIEHATPRWLIKQGLDSAVADPAALTDQAVDQYWDMLRYNGNRAATVQRFTQIEPRPVIDADQIQVPTLILWGEQDRLIPVDQARRWHEALPDSDLIIYPELGHLPAEEAPAKTAADLTAFLREKVGF